MDDIDKDGDGKISIDEYIGDMYSTAGDPDSEPDWVKAERESFKNFRDENKVGINTFGLFRFGKIQAQTLRGTQMEQMESVKIRLPFQKIKYNFYETV